MTSRFDPEKAIKTIQQFISDQLELSGLSGFVVGLSGGIDSAVSCAMAARAVGTEKVLALSMPYRASSEASRTDAALLAEQCGIEMRTIDISPMIDAYYDLIDEPLRLRAGNKMARERMSVLFDVAFQMNRLVLGTGNRTEIALGYTTLYGDAACSVNPIGELYKTELRAIAALIGLPVSIRTKAPSADLWVGQTDEGEIGLSYEQIDRSLKLLIDENITSLTMLTKHGASETEATRVVELINRNHFKRSLPPVASLGQRPIPDHISLED